MRKSLLVSFFVLAGALSAAAQSPSPTFYFAQIADGQEGGGFFWRTTIFLTNPASSGAPISGSIAFGTAAGQPFQLSFVDESNQPVGGGNSLPYQIAPLQTKKFVSSGAPPLNSGYAIVNGNGPISGTAVFSRYGPNGAIVGEASVPGVGAPSTHQAIVIDTTGGFNTGVAVALTGNSAPPISLRLLNTQGVDVVPSTTTTSPVFQLVGFVAGPGGFFQSAPPTVGTLQISSTAPFATVGLRFAPAPSGAFTTLSPVTLASLVQPTLKWLEQRAGLSPFSSLARLWAGVQLRAA
jgi:hypothetical protein